MDEIWGKWFGWRTVFHAFDMAWGMTPSNPKFNMTILEKIMNYHHGISVMVYEMVKSCLEWWWHSHTRRVGLLHTSYPLLRESKIWNIQNPNFFIMELALMNFRQPLLLMLHHLWQHQTNQFSPFPLWDCSSIYTALLYYFIYFSLDMLVSSISIISITSFTSLMVFSLSLLHYLLHNVIDKRVYHLGEKEGLGNP